MARTARSVQLRGRVLDAAGAPVAGAALGLAARSVWTSEGVLAQPTAKTGADGRFILVAQEPAADAATLSCFVVAPGLASAELPLPGFAEAEVDCGDLQLTEGATLKGRVRGKDGKPVAGARVEATDLLPGTTGRLTFTGAATTAADGAFQLPCALPQAGRLTVSAAGHYTATLAPAGVGEPLVLELTPSGFVSGRVLDAAGKPARAAVLARHETGLGTPAVQTSADGSFRSTVAHRGRFRLSATERGNNARSQSALLPGPTDGVVLQASPANRATGGLAVRALDAATGRAIAEFKAGVTWHPAGFQFQGEVPTTTASGADGLVHLNGPSSSRAAEGMVRVTAPGFAPAVVRELEAKEDEESVVEAKLVKESVLEGRVVDEASGQPLPGATVSIARPAEPQAAVAGVAGAVFTAGGRSNTRPAVAATTGPDGSFRLGELGAGTYELTVQCPRRPELRSERLKLGAQETRKDVVLKVGKGLTLDGRLTGLTPGSRWSVRLVEDHDETGRLEFLSALRAPSEQGLTAVMPNGSFSVVGLKPGNYALRLVVPGAPRSGPPLDVLVDKLRLKQDLKRDFDLAGDGPGRLRGKLTVTGASLPRGRLVVQATVETKDADGNPFARMAGPSASARRTLLAPDGSYALELGSGAYRIELLDLLTNIVVHRASETVQVTGAAEATKDLSVALVPLRVSFLPESYVAASLTIGLEHDAQDPQVTRVLTAISGAGGSALSLVEAPREVTLFVPPGDVKLAVHGRANTVTERMAANGAGVAVMGRAGTTEPPLAEAEVTVKAGEPAQVTLTIPASPASEDTGGKK